MYQGLREILIKNLENTAVSNCLRSDPLTSKVTLYRHNSTAINNAVHCIPAYDTGTNSRSKGHIPKNPTNCTTPAYNEAFA